MAARQYRLAPLMGPHCLTWSAVVANVTGPNEIEKRVVRESKRLDYPLPGPNILHSSSSSRKAKSGIVHGIEKGKLMFGEATIDRRQSFRSESSFLSFLRDDPENSAFSANEVFRRLWRGRIRLYPGLDLSNSRLPNSDGLHLVVQFSLPSGIRTA